MISVVIVNYNGFSFLKPLFESLRKQIFKDFEVIMVDNASNDDSVSFVKKNFPEVIIKKNDKNLGFAGGNNSALPLCKGEYLVFLNNDTTVDPDWLLKLYIFAKKNPDCVAVGSKILFYRPFVSLNFEIKNLGKKSEEGETKVKSIDFVGSDYLKIFFSKKSRTENNGSHLLHLIRDGEKIRIPFSPDSNRENFILRVRMFADRSQRVKIRIGKETISNEKISATTKLHRIEISQKLLKNNSFFIVNNAGSQFDPRTGHGKDIGMEEKDHGQYDKPREVESLCGGSFLIKKSVVRKYGLFDSYFFAYYEDTDLCWRLRNKGLKLFLEPASVVYHFHTGTTKEWSPFFIYHVERNRLAMLLRNGKVTDFAREFFLLLKRTAEEKDWGRKKINLKAILSLVFRSPVILLQKINLMKVK